ncbi:helix-turn-helix transcriptional regulator [Aggregatimonas sangjinii]|uniref:Helix-turn-helix transcriptional regulator n=1 Tax=Aggregatimonas sangjinii TaxID=2583587 RepID=A0A5B7SU83_9FLAO|nr:helix-turn-helix transcriptional regulator [Aggregatimonas sangjinii]QCX00909.1 helix-turn-helix transcriptional regulator [Aggregatimonas sangjinii]
MKQPELGNRISQLRKAKGLTQEELVERCNVSVRTIQRIETGEVNPRSFTVKTILSALDSNFDELHADSSFSKNVSKTLHIAWIAGIIYFVLGLLEGPMDMNRIIINSEIPRDTISNFIPMITVGPYAYVTVKIFVCTAYLLFLRGFGFMGRYTGNSMLYIVSNILMGIMFFVVVFDIVSFFYTEWNGLFVQMAIALSLGMLGIVFGIALIQLRSGLGAICIFAGAIEILAGILLIFLQPFGLVVQMVAVLLEIMIIYQFSIAIAEGADMSISK